MHYIINKLKHSFRTLQLCQKSVINNSIIKTRFLLSLKLVSLS